MVRLKGRGYNNVLPAEGYRPPQGPVIDEYGAVVKWRFSKENRRSSEKALINATP
jgi:hypothetical protein